MTKAPSRKVRADGEATRARILEVAGRLFAARGYADTTSKSIAVEAGVNLATINHHFRSRSGLYVAVLAEAHNRLVSLSDLSALARGNLAPSGQLKVLLEFLVHRAKRRTGWHMRLLAREIAAPSPPLRDFFKVAFAPKAVIVKRLIGQITGLPPDHPAVLRCLLNIGAPCAMLLAVGRGIPGPMRQVSRMPEPELVQHLHDFAMGGLRAIARQHADASSST